METLDEEIVEHDNKNLEAGQFGLVLSMGLKPMMQLGQMEASFFTCSDTWILLTLIAVRYRHSLSGLVGQCLWGQVLK